MTEPPVVPSIRRGYYEQMFEAVETKACDRCMARPGDQCWDRSAHDPLIRAARVVPHIERIEAWVSTTPTE